MNDKTIKESETTAVSLDWTKGVISHTFTRTKDDSLKRQFINKIIFNMVYIHL